MRLGLYSDIMLALSGGVGMSRDDYLTMRPSDPSAPRMRQARELLWDRLSGFAFNAL